MLYLIDFDAPPGVCPQEASLEDSLADLVHDLEVFRDEANDLADRCGRVAAGGLPELAALVTRQPTYPGSD